jgi:hypothetical protein
MALCSQYIQSSLEPSFSSCYDPCFCSFILPQVSTRDHICHLGTSETISLYRVGTSSKSSNRRQSITRSGSLICFNLQYFRPVNLVDISERRTGGRSLARLANGVLTSVVTSFRLASDPTPDFPELHFELLHPMLAQDTNQSTEVKFNYSV